MKTQNKKKTQLVGRELWLTAVHENRITPSPRGTKSKPVSRSQTEFWSDSLRRSGQGGGVVAADRKPFESFTNLHRTQPSSVPYLSTSHYMREAVGREPPSWSFSGGGVGPDPNRRVIPNGTPSYKPPEDYCDEIVALKKQIIHLNGENDALRCKFRQVGEDNFKKEKQLEKYLDPEKNDEMRRLLGDKKVDSLIVIESLKKKMMKLECQFRDKEEEFLKLQTDIRYTNAREMKTQVEVLKKEVTRLRNLNVVDLAYAKETMPGGEGEEVDTSGAAMKVEALTKTLKQINEEKTKLATENAEMRMDLERLMEQTKELDSVKPCYEDMSQNGLLKVIAKQNKELKELRPDESKKPVLKRSDTVDTVNKIELDGSLRDRLDLLDKRETELLSEIKTRDATIKRLQEDRIAQKEKLKGKSNQVDELVDKCKQAGLEVKLLKPAPSVSSETSSVRQRKKVDDFQNNWRHPQPGSFSGNEEDATELIQAALRGYNTREKRLKTQHSGSRKAYSNRQESVSSLASRSGHQNSQRSMNSFTSDESASEDDLSFDTPRTPFVDSSSRRSSSRVDSVKKQSTTSLFARKLASEDNNEFDRSTALSSKHKYSEQSHIRPSSATPSRASSYSGAVWGAGAHKESFSRRQSTLNEDDDF